MIPVGDSVSSRTFPYVNLAIIAVNLLVFAYELLLGSEVQRNQFLCDWGTIPRDVTNLFAPPSRPEVALGPCGFSSSEVGVDVLLRPFTSMFMHAGWFHILGNMLFLWIFGDNVEDALGHVRYLLFYLLCGLGAAAAHILMSPDSLLPAVGASGAIAGVMGAYLVLYPKANIAVLIPCVHPSGHLLHPGYRPDRDLVPDAASQWYRIYRLRDRWWWWSSVVGTRRGVPSRHAADHCLPPPPPLSSPSAALLLNVVLIG